MGSNAIDEAIKWLEKANADLEPDLLTKDAARSLATAFARAENLAAYGRTMLARKLEDPGEVARVSGVSIGKAKAALDAGAALRSADDVRDAFRGGHISLDQASEIARAEQAQSGSSSGLLTIAKSQPFNVLRESARKVVLEAEQRHGLAVRQHDARSARNYCDALGMVHIDLVLEPHVGARIVNRAETEGARLNREAKKAERAEPFERHLADAYAGMLEGGATTGRARRPELVVLVSHAVAARGWNAVEDDEICKIPGVGPVSPEVAKRIADDAFLTGVFYDGKDLRHMKRWTRSTPPKCSLRWS